MACPEFVAAHNHVDLVADVGQVARLFGRRVAAAHHGYVLSAVEETVAGGACAHAHSLEFVFGGQSEVFGRCAGGYDERLGFDGAVAVHGQDEGISLQIDIGDDAPAYFHAEAFGLFAEVLHELRTHDAFRVSGKVLDFGRRGELSAGQHSLVEDGAEVRASRVYCGRISCGAAAHDEAFYSFYAHNCRFICLAKIGNLPLINPKRL